jgi:hypothetical protein
MTLFLLGSKDTTVLLVHGNFIFLLNPNNLFLFHLPALSNGYDHTDTSIMIPRLIASTTEHKFFDALLVILLNKVGLHTHELTFLLALLL